MEKFFQRFVSRIFTLLFVPFESKSVIFSPSVFKSMLYLVFEANRTQVTSSRIFKGSLRLWLLINFYPKGIKSSVFNDLQIFEWCFSKRFGFLLTAARQKFAQYMDNIPYARKKTDPSKMNFWNRPQFILLCYFCKH